MSLTACQLYVKGLLQGLQSPQLPPVTAQIQPPVLSDATTPQAFIWAGRAPIKRQTAPRVIRQPTGGFSPGGYHKASWQVAVRLYVVMSTDDDNLETAFPALVDATIVELITTPIAIIVTDPITGQNFEILTIGESIDVNYVSAIAQQLGQGLVRFACDLVTLVEEKLAPSEGNP